MLKSTILPTVAFVFLIVFGIGTVSADVANKPTHKSGEWWELSIKTNNIDHGDFTGLDGEYRIEATADGFKCLYRDVGKWTDNCGDAKEVILNVVLGVGKDKYLRFPISVGKKWKFSSEGHSGRHGGESQVNQIEKIAVAGKELASYRIEHLGEWRGRRHSGSQSVLYWYAPACKCIPKLKIESEGDTWGSELVEVKLTRFKGKK